MSKTKKDPVPFGLGGSRKKEKKMELKTRYQYTYFINTFTVKENKYSKYILRLLRDSRFKLRIFKKEKLEL